MSEAKTAFDKNKGDVQDEHTARIHVKLMEDVPELVSGTTPLGVGSQGIILDCHDGTVFKVFLRGEKSNESEFLSEVQLLERLGGQDFDTAKTPELLEKVEIPNSELAYAAYRMTKLEVEGSEFHWKPFEQTASVEKIEHHFRNVGAVLASFHTKAAPIIDNITPPPKHMTFGAEIATIPQFNARVNEALSRCNAYLQQHMKPGVNHGDFNPGNFFTNKQKNITHLFDFSFSGLVPNYLTDFAQIPPESAHYAIDEYERVTGKTVDPKMLCLTQISHYVALINHNFANQYPESPEVIRNVSTRLISHLNKVSDITGMRFDAQSQAFKF